MKTLIRLLIKLAFFSLVLYGVVFSFYRTGEDEIVLLKESGSEKIIQSYSSAYNFIWQGVMPWRYSVYKMPLKGSALLTISVRIPSLTMLADDQYLIKFPATVKYKFDKSNLPDLKYIESKNSMENFILERSELVVQSVLMKYIEPVYDKRILEKNENIVIDTLISEIISRVRGAGVIIENVEFMRPGYYPDNSLYSDGLAQNREMRDLDFSNRKQEIMLNKRLIKEKYENELYYEKLLRISGLLKDNPDILKFIYIDKMGDDVRVIISSDRTGIPSMFNESLDKAKPGVKGDVDNLR